MAKYVCKVCGYTAEGEAPEKCPVCGAGKEAFIEMAEGEKNYADEHRIGVAKDVDAEILEGLRANFMGECTEVGMYIAMARQADREGYPEIGLYFPDEKHPSAEGAYLKACVEYLLLFGKRFSPDAPDCGIPCAIALRSVAEAAVFGKNINDRTI